VLKNLSVLAHLSTQQLKAFWQLCNSI